MSRLFEQPLPDAPPGFSAPWPPPEMACWDPAGETYEVSQEPEKRVPGAGREWRYRLVWRDGKFVAEPQ